jgi:hypothetical protein
MDRCSKCINPKHTLFGSTNPAARKLIPSGEYWCYDCLGDAYKEYLASPAGIEEEAHLKRLREAMSKPHTTQQWYT